MKLRVLKYVLLGILVLGGLSVLGHACGWCGEAAQVAREEFGPREALRKYEWFKNVAAALEAKQANVSATVVTVTTMRDDYGTVREMPRDERQEYRLLQAELVGLKRSFNNLAAEYNAQMAKFNWRFANKGELPKGATEPLPREFKAYLVR